MEPSDRKPPGQVRSCPACPEQRRRDRAGGMPSRSLDRLLHQQYKRNVVLVSSPESAIRGSNLGFEVLSVHRNGSQGIACNLRLPSAAFLPVRQIRQQQTAVY